MGGKLCESSSAGHLSFGCSVKPEHPTHSKYRFSRKPTRYLPPPTFTHIPLRLDAPPSSKCTFRNLPPPSPPPSLRPSALREPDRSAVSNLRFLFAHVGLRNGCNSETRSIPASPLLSPVSEKVQPPLQTRPPRSPCNSHRATTWIRVEFGGRGCPKRAFPKQQYFDNRKGVSLPGLPSHQATTI